jgi:hypothetical protein
MCLLAGPSVANWAAPATKGLIARLQHDVLNARDLASQRRGYYEQLDTGGVNREEKAWFEGMKVFYRGRSDFLMGEIVPSVSTILEGSAVTSNHFGMRDHEYDRIKQANTYRIVLSGSSHEMGAGVRDDQTFENLVEDHLNRVLPDGHYSRYEILNLSMGGHSVLQRLLRLEQLGFEFQPDAAIFCVSGIESQLVVQHLTKCINRGIIPPSDYREIVEQITRRAGVQRRMPDVMIERNLRPYVPEIYDWVFRRFAAECAQCGVHPLVVYRPAPVDFEGTEASARAEMVRIARAAGLEVIDLSPAFDSVANRNTLVVTKWDDHSNALAHRLLADKLYDVLVQLLFSSPGKQQTAHLQKR